MTSCSRSGSRAFWLVLACAIAAVVFTTHPAAAQVLYGSIVGQVLDQTGAIVPNASVSATNPATGFKAEATTDQGGRYTIPNLQPGTYEVTFTSTGFKTFSRQNVGVTINNVTRVDVNLEIGQLTEQVTVSAAGVSLQTDRADTHTDLSTKAITTLPLNQFRNYQALLNLVPGATPTAFQNSATDTPGRALTTNVNGTARNNNNTRLDGAMSVNVWLPHHTSYTPPSETIETVNIATSGFDAEQGMAGGSAITVVTKSGTNELHGSAFEYHNNQHLRARNFFMPATTEKPRDTLNIFGGTLGGPIIKNKLFYFGGFERYTQRTGGSGLFTVPTAAQRAGNFSGLVDANGGGVIYDPATGNANGVGRTPFPGNQIPANRISPIAQQILQLVPQPNLPGTANNYFAAATGKFDRDQYDFKVNYNRNERHMIWGKYSFMPADVTGVGAFGELIGSSVVNDPGTGHTFVQVPTIGHTYTFSANVLMDQTFGFSRMSQNVIGADFGTNWGLDRFGIPGTNGPDPRQSGLPAFNFTTYSPYGQIQTWMPMFRTDQSYTHSTNVNWNKGAHDLRFGFDMVRHHLNHWQPEVANPRGSFTFGGGVTSLPGGTAPNQFNSFAGFLLGLPTSMDKSLQYLTMSGREWQFGWYARDRWQVTRRLTLNLGIRLEHYPLMTRAGSGIERLDPSTMLIYMGGRGNVPTDAGITVNTPLWAPRLGVAYRVTERTVIRTGYGLSPDPLPFSRPLRGWYPYTIAANFVGADTFTAAGSLATGIPAFSGPDISSGIVALPPNIDNRSPYDTIHRGYIQSWNFIVEQRLPFDMVGTAGYVGTQTTHQLADRDINAAAPGAGNNGRPLYSQFGRNTLLRMWDGYLSANYHSLQTSLNRQFKNGLLLKGAYTWSKAINMTDDDGWADVMWNWGPAFPRNRAVAGYDRTHVLQMAWVYELPFGSGKQHLNSGPVSWVLGNWQVNGLFTHFSGTPFTVTASGASLNAPGNAQTADQKVADVRQIGGIGSGQYWLDPTAFAPVSDVRFGTTGRNAFRGPGVTGLDASLFRNFPLTERFNLQFRAEAFNLTNTPRFNNPNADVTGGDFMSITGTRFDSDRQLRFGLRLGF